MLGQSIQRAGVDKSAPPHGPADPDWTCPCCHSEDSHAAVGTVGRADWSTKIEKWQTRPGLGHGFVEEFPISGEFLADREGPDEVGRGEDIRFMQRHLPGLDTARKAARIGPAELSQRRQALLNQGGVAGEPCRPDRLGHDARREPVGMVGTVRPAVVDAVSWPAERSPCRRAGRSPTAGVLSRREPQRSPPPGRTRATGPASGHARSPRHRAIRRKRPRSLRPPPGRAGQGPRCLPLDAPTIT